MHTTNTLNLKMNFLMCILFGALSLSNAFENINNLDDLFEKLGQAGDNLVVAAFTAPWCGPCKPFSNALTTVEGEFSNVVFLQGNVDLLPDVVEYYDIGSVPTTILFRTSQLLEKNGIARSEIQLRELIQSHV